jgi:hypothetical protein
MKSLEEKDPLRLKQYDHSSGGSLNMSFMYKILVGIVVCLILDVFCWLIYYTMIDEKTVKSFE